MELVSIGGASAVSSLSTLPNFGVDLRETDANRHEIKAAFAFMDGQDQNVVDILKTGISADPDNEALWRMTFDMYRVIGDQNSFDNLSLKFAERFGMSPPSWVPIPGMKSESDEKENADAIVRILAVTKSTMAHPVATAIDTVGNGGTITLDFSNVGNSDKDGLLMLNSGLSKVAEMKGDIKFIAAEKFINAIAEHAKSSGKSLSQLWDMAFLMMRLAGMSDKYEEFSVSYAEIFEEMPAVWVPYVPSAIKVAAEENDQMLKPIQGAIPMIGKVANISAADITRMSGMAQAGRLLLDMRACARLALAPAMALSSLFNESKQPVVVTGANHMVKHAIIYSALLPMSSVTFKEA